MKTMNDECRMKYKEYACERTKKRFGIAFMVCCIKFAVFDFESDAVPGNQIQETNDGPQI